MTITAEQCGCRIDEIVDCCGRGGLKRSSPIHRKDYWRKEHPAPVPVVPKTKPMMAPVTSAKMSYSEI